MEKGDARGAKCDHAQLTRSRSPWKSTDVRHIYRLRSTLTRPKPVGHGYVFSMAVGTIGECSVNLVPFYVRGRTVDWGGGSILAVKHLKINILAWVTRKINK